MTMREKIAAALYPYVTAYVEERDTGNAEFDEISDFSVLSTFLADVVLDAMMNVDNDILAEGYRAMFVGEWDGSQAPMMGAGWDAMITAAKA